MHEDFFFLWFEYQDKCKKFFIILILMLKFEIRIPVFASAMQCKIN